MWPEHCAPASIWNSMTNYSIPLEIRQANSPVFRHEIAGVPVWVKQARRPENPIGRWAQTMLYGITGLPLLTPPGKMTNNQVRFEAETLTRMADLGVPVPTVLHLDEEYFVMSDCGPNLVHLLKDDPGGTPARLEQALRALRNLHNRGQAHGGSQIKNFTVLDGRVHFIDFEENIPDERLADFQLRDVFLFMLSLERHNLDPDLPRLCRVYAEEDWREVWERLRRALGQLRMVRLSEWRVFNRLSMRDIRSLSRLVAKARPDNETANRI